MAAVAMEVVAVREAMELATKVDTVASKVVVMVVEKVTLEVAVGGELVVHLIGNITHGLRNISQQSGEENRRWKQRACR